MKKYLVLLLTIIVTLTACGKKEVTNNNTPVKQISVPIAEVQIEAGQEITADMISIIQVDEDKVENDIITRKENIIGKTTKSSVIIKAGSMIHSSDLN